LTQTSGFYTTAGSPTGHQVASYTQAIAAKAWAIMAACYNFEGVAPSYLNALVGSVPGVNTARIGTGGAVVDGQWYKNDAAYDVTIPSAVGGGNTRIDRVVLRVTWASFQCVITRIAGTDAASPVAPAITQTPGTTYDILLYQALVNTGGTVTLTDERVYAWVADAGIATNAVTTAKILAANVTLAKMAANSIDSDQYVDGSIDYEHDSAGASKVTGRVGGSATEWGTVGTTNYVPTSARIQVGAAVVGAGGNVSISFPVAFAFSPIVVITVRTANRACYRQNLSASAFDAYVTDLANTPAGGDVEWIAIGPA